MSKTPDEKRTILVQRVAKILQVDPERAKALLNTTRGQSIRINTLKVERQAALAGLEALGWIGKSYSWIPDGYTIETSIEPIRDSKLVAEGKVFIQNAASWLPVIALDPKPDEQILDICAAPGGKSSHIAALTNNRAKLWVNDNSRARLAKMQANFARLGVTPERITLYDAQQLARKLDRKLFDKILLDAPCSGEGLMHYERDKDFATWSVAHIKRLQQLQKRLINQAWQLLKPGGTMVYSTCTMAPEENEAVVNYLLRSQPDAEIVLLDIQLPNRVPTVTTWNSKTYSPGLSGCIRLTPSKQLEAFFVCKLKRLALPE
ncbi:MAG TPA: RsmB/NOP family class I SAM-dependent RNA methyltransferase [Candidatus Saccharimonadales bacterium]|nr:RsmB/NOP family class I SAM-dependent RNA methyltransferase [Candidatus Saccharimonadales bacterium]